MTDFPEPTAPRATRADVLLGCLGFFRGRVLAKVEALPEVGRDRSLLPSGWTALQLVRYLANVERRWLEWGFEGVQVDDPWVDHIDGRWSVPAGVEPPATLERVLLHLVQEYARHLGHLDVVVEL